MPLYDEIWNSDQSPEMGRCPARHGLLRIKGSDATEFLQRICSQDVASLQPGQAVWTAFLTGKGKLEATACLGRGADTLWLECPREVLQPVADLLERYHFAEALSIDLMSDFTAIEIAGPSALQKLELVPMTCREAAGDLVLYGFERHGQSWARCHGRQPDLEALPGIAELAVLADAMAESLRLLRGELLFGTDVDAKTLALEAGLDDHVSTSKGCYIGQEIVARIQTYGHVNRALTLLRIEDQAAVTPGTMLHEPEKGDPVGRITSSVEPPGGGYRLALGYLPEAFLAAGSELRVGGLEGPKARVLGFGQ